MKISPSRDAVEARASYEDRKARLQRELIAARSAAGADGSVRLGKDTSNLFRRRATSPAARLDVRDFDGVLSIDPAGRTAEVQGMTTYEHLADATLAWDLMPLVVPQLKTITLGGAVAGLGIESSSFRNGMPHESVIEMDVLTGDGNVVTARRDNEHRDLFFGFPNSYGTLGYALRLVIELEPVKPFVRLCHVRHVSPEDYFSELAEICRAGRYAGGPVDFVDGTLFAADELYLTLGSFVDEAPNASDYTGMDIYYQSIPQQDEDFLTVRDYLWRWDTDWFWCSRAFGVQKAWIRRLVPRRYLRSDVYWRLVALDRRFGIARRIDRFRGRPNREPVIQDVEIPVENASRFLDFFRREIGIEPIWVCPIRQRSGETWDLYRLDPDTLYVNFGFWSSVPLADDEPDGTHNRLIERVVDDLGGRKSLYSTSYYDEDDFWRLYNGASYRALKSSYDPHGRLSDLYAKCVERR